MLMRLQFMSGMRGENVFSRRNDVADVRASGDMQTTRRLEAKQVHLDWVYRSGAPFAWVVSPPSDSCPNTRQSHTFHTFQSTIHLLPITSSLKWLGPAGLHPLEALPFAILHSPPTNTFPALLFLSMRPRKSRLASPRNG
jgi:hypothetical protein